MSPYLFEVYSADHLISFLVIISLYILFLRYNEFLGIKSNSPLFTIILSIIIIFLDISEDLFRLATGYYSIINDLPLQLCTIGIYVSVYTLLTKNQTAFELIFYWGLVGASQAIITPDGDLFQLKIFFLYSQAYHSMLIFIVLWMMIKNDMRMSFSKIPKVFFITNGVVFIICIFNYLLDSNYLFLRFRPNSISPFLIGDWPIYIIMVEIFSVIVLIIFINIQNKLLKPAN